jgi:hypothetical protein
MMGNITHFIIRDGVPVGFFDNEVDAKRAMRLCCSGFIVEVSRFKRLGD